MKTGGNVKRRAIYALIAAVVTAACDRPNDITSPRADLTRAPSTEGPRPTASATVTSGLSAFYPFTEEGVGGDGGVTTPDESGNGYTAQVFGATRVADRFGDLNSAYAFDGQGDSIIVPAEPTNSRSSGTISLWLRINNPTTPGVCGRSYVTGSAYCQYNIFAKRVSGSSEWLRAQFGGDVVDSLYFVVHGENPTFARVSANLADWHMYTFVWDASRTAIYLDGGRVLQSAGGQTSNSSGDLFLGVYPQGAYEQLNGAMDEVRIYDRALSDAEVSELYELESTPANKAPVASAGGPYTGAEGNPVALDGSASSDPDGNALTYTWDFGDGSASSGVTPSHIYADNGVYSVTLTVNDGKGGTHAANAVVTVHDVLPAITTPPSVPAPPIAVGNAVTVTTVFTGASVDAFAAAVHWGDTTTWHAPSPGPFSAPHTYNAAGVYTISVSITDDDGNTVSRSADAYVVVYDPNGGFVTGGGWISSPAGAYPEAPSLAGKATFGFVSKYQKGATIPSGNTEFQFHAGSLDFHGETYDWLVIAGARAQYKGVGAIKGRAGTFRFLLTAIDGDVAGDGVDKFRIKIWDAVTGGVIYDNQIGQLDESGAATALGGGSVMIHEK